MNRRIFLRQTTLSAAALSLWPAWSQAMPAPEWPGLFYFSKHLQWLDFPDLAIALSEAGFDGADLTVRSGGHIEPENAAQALPKAVKALAKHGLTLPMVVTRITDPEEPGLDDFLNILADNGVKFYRTGYLAYDHQQSIPANLARFNDRLKRLAEMNARHGLHGAYQNHAGNRLGASIWDLREALQGIDPQHLGCQFDLRHATYEGGRSWTNDFRAIAPWVKTAVVKDFFWEKNEKGKWTNHNTLMGEGMVNFEEFFRLYDELGIQGPLSNHSEYELLTPAERELPKRQKMDAAIARLRQDVAFTREFWNR